MVEMLLCHHQCNGMCGTCVFQVLLLVRCCWAMRNCSFCLGSCMLSTCTMLLSGGSPLCRLQACACMHNMVLDSFLPWGNVQIHNSLCYVSESIISTPSVSGHLPIMRICRVVLEPMNNVGSTTAMCPCQSEEMYRERQPHGPAHLSYQRPPCL